MNRCNQHLLLAQADTKLNNDVGGKFVLYLVAGDPVDDRYEPVRSTTNRTKHVVLDEMINDTRPNKTIRLDNLFCRGLRT